MSLNENQLKSPPMGQKCDHCREFATVRRTLKPSGYQAGMTWYLDFCDEHAKKFLSEIPDAPADNAQAVLQKWPNWISVSDKSPPIIARPSLGKPYVLAVDSKGRMSIGYALENSTVPFTWVFAKPIGEPTHWMPLPNAPSVGRPTDEQSQPLLSQESSAVAPSVVVGVEEKEKSL